MTARAWGVNTPKIFIYFFSPHFLFLFSEIVIQQQERTVFIECNLFMVMAQEKGTGVIMRCELEVGEKVSARC